MLGEKAREEVGDAALQQTVGTRNAHEPPEEDGKKKLVITSLWTEVCLAMPAITPYYACGAADKVPQLWFYADNDRLYKEALIREYEQAFVASGGGVRFELLHGVPRDGHLLRLYPDRWRPIADEFLTSLDRRSSRAGIER
jgi:hypothetical protein